MGELGTMGKRGRESGGEKEPDTRQSAGQWVAAACWRPWPGGAFCLRFRVAARIISGLGSQRRSLGHSWRRWEWEVVGTKGLFQNAQEEDDDARSA